jgi:hypothetical protein
LLLVSTPTMQTEKNTISTVYFYDVVKFQEKLKLPRPQCVLRKLEERDEISRGMHVRYSLCNYFGYNNSLS